MGVHSNRAAFFAVAAAAAMTAPACGGGGDNDPASASSARTRPLHARVKEVASIPVGPEPTGLAVGFGSVWALSHPSHVARIDPGTNTVTARIQAPNGGFLGVGEGAVWIPDYDGGTVRRIDSVTNEVVATIPVGEAPAGVAFASGAVWVANHHGGSVSRIDPRTNTVVTTVRVGPTGRSGPQALAVGSAAVWVAVPNLASVVRIDPTSNRIVAKIALPSEVPPCGGLAADDRAVWVSAGGCGVGVARIDPATNRIEDVLLAKRGQPLEYGVEVGAPTVAAGSVWFSKGTPTSPFLYELDAATGRTLSKMRLRSGVGDSTFAFGSVWLGDPERGRVMRLEPK